jgi:signal transduction histidine kinase
MGQLQVAMNNPQKANDNLSSIYNASLELKSIIHDVLDISGIEYGVFKLSDSRFSPRKLIHRTAQDAACYANEKNQTIKSFVDNALPKTLVGDEKRLYQVIQNLLINAVKFTPERGDIQIRARVLREGGANSKKDDDRITLAIEVVDNGIGIPKEQQDMLFNIFEQIDGGSTRKHGGLGIGLALSKRLIEMMDGNIWVESEAGKGAKFTFTCRLGK